MLMSASYGIGLWTGFVVLILMSVASILSCIKRRRRRLAAEVGYSMGSES